MCNSIRISPRRAYQSDTLSDMTIFVGTIGRKTRLRSMKRLQARTGLQAMMAVVIIAAIIVTLVNIASMPVTQPDGTLDAQESVVDPS
ncbi:hypothetical protein [Rhizobium subbaraonis]|uniref:hypothetical protein n=1 Tax=Rhizobium subbaraonis TaxID=908946 RepID=UPI000BE2D21F|nr:hypothetical protein [Rhizobium subbaraonis]